MTVGPLQLICFGVRSEAQRDAVSQALRAHSQRGAVRILEVGYVRRRGESASPLDDEPRLLLADTGELRGSPVLGSPAARGTPTHSRSAVDGMLRVDPETGGTSARSDLGESVEQVREQIASIADELSAESSLYMALIEHHWAPALKDTVQSLRDSLQAAGVVVLAARMIRPSPLALVPSRLIATHQIPLQ